MQFNHFHYYTPKWLSYSPCQMSNTLSLNFARRMKNKNDYLLIILSVTTNLTKNCTVNDVFLDFSFASRSLKISMRRIIKKDVQEAEFLNLIRNFYCFCCSTLHMWLARQVLCIWTTCSNLFISESESEQKNLQIMSNEHVPYTQREHNNLLFVWAKNYLCT